MSDLYWFSGSRPTTCCGPRGISGTYWSGSSPAYLVCLLTGAISPPAGVGAGWLSLLSFWLGQVIAYLVVLLLDLSCSGRW